MYLKYRKYSEWLLQCHLIIYITSLDYYYRALTCKQYIIVIPSHGGVNDIHFIYYCEVYSIKNHYSLEADVFYK